MKTKYVILVILFGVFFSCFGQQKMKPKETEIWEPKPKIVTPGKNNSAPSDAVVLFDGTNLDQWVYAKDGAPANWHLNADGSMTVKDKAGDIKTKQEFGNVQLHIEWKSPIEVQGKNQSRANSGVLLQSRYEIQVLDNNNNDTYVNGQVASVYKQSIPLVNASASTGDWNTYDIIFHQPEFDENGQVVKKATITVIHNGVLVQDHFTIQGTTAFIGHPKYEKHGKASLKLQDHRDNSRVSYRNIWIREL
ncbi:3-keto-disaccharide hydrolase [Flavivirga jejuensis]|uniref:DUF1080 domain-containing protein n=1 Tax=Flavivirga jejuensis TaxID=870487 RepID=A0ABT8WIN6_9FLAO|nr:DUF1080 domain-containing protein [Flavivirga jejuensis]MDO5973019.1 DUF1080 domain-containing protein [Flavivirga jejuensis]